MLDFMKMLNVRIARIEYVISASMQYDKVIMTQKKLLNSWSNKSVFLYSLKTLKSF